MAPTTRRVRGATLPAKQCFQAAASRLLCYFFFLSASLQRVHGAFLRSTGATTVLRPGTTTLPLSPDVRARCPGRYRCFSPPVQQPTAPRCRCGPAPCPAASADPNPDPRCAVAPRYARASSSYAIQCGAASPRIPSPRTRHTILLRKRPVPSSRCPIHAL